MINTIIVAILSLITCPDVVRDFRIDIQDLIGVIVDWGRCPGQCPADVVDDGDVNTDDLLCVIGAWGECPSMPLPYDQCPRIYTSDPEAFRVALLDYHPEGASDIMYVGDSTGARVLSVGTNHMDWRDWLWHLRHGHTPRSFLSPTYPYFYDAPPPSAEPQGSEFMQSLRWGAGLGFLGQQVDSSRMIPGISNFAYPVTAGTYSHGLKRITQVGAFTSYVWADLDMFRLTAGTGATINTYRVAAKIDNNTIELVNSIGAGADGSTDIAGQLHIASGGGHTTKFGGTGTPAVDYLFNCGHYIRLNHANANQDSVGDSGAADKYGHLHEPDMEDQGHAEFASGNMLLGKSLIDVASGLRLEVVAVRFQNAANNNPTAIDWYFRPLRELEGLTTGLETGGIDAPMVTSGTLFGGAESLRGAEGVAYKAQTPVLPALVAPRIQYQIQIAGSEYSDFNQDNRGAQFWCRWVSENQRGISSWTAGRGGFSAGVLAAAHSACGYLIEKIGSNVAWYMLGLNNRVTDSPAVFKAAVLADITLLFASGIELVVLETEPEPSSDLTNYDEYAGALYELAQADSRIMFVNSRLVLEEDYGWDPAIHTGDGLHPNNLGAEYWARASIGTVLTYLDAPPALAITSPVQMSAFESDVVYRTSSPTLTITGTCSDDLYDFADIHLSGLYGATVIDSDIVNNLDGTWSVTIDLVDGENLFRIGVQEDVVGGQSAETLQFLIEYSPAAFCRPNRATGTRARISVQEETCWGEEATPGTQNALGVEYVSETLRNTINTIESGLIRGDRMRAATQQGNQRPGGDINGELQPHGVWPLLLLHALGGSASTAGSGPYVHTLQGSIDLPEGLTFEKRFGYPDGTFNWLRYYGSRVNEFGLSIPTEGIVTARAGIIARQEFEASDDIDSVPTFPGDNEPFNSFQGAILMDQDGSGTRTAIATIMSLDMLINNNIDGDQFAIDGNAYRADVPEDIRVINGNITAMFTRTNWQLYQAYLADTMLSMQFTLTRGLYSWQFTIPAFKIRGDPTPQVAGRGPLNIEMQWEAQRDDDTGTDIQVVITNDDEAISTAA